MYIKKRKLGRGVALVGAGICKFGAYPREVAAADLFCEAFREMISSIDKEFELEDIEACYLGVMSSELFENQSHTAASLVGRLGIAPAAATRVENACASSGVAFRQGVMAIASGIYDMVLVGGMEKMTNLTTMEVTRTLSLALDPLNEIPSGQTFPGIFATIANAHMKKYGTTADDLMRVAIQNHHNASLNPKAHLNFSIKDLMRKRAAALVAKSEKINQWANEIDFLKDETQNPFIAWPLRLFDCSTVCDGASCALLVSEEIVKQFTDKGIHVIGTGQASDYAINEREDITTMAAVKKAAGDAYVMAGVKPRDIKIAEVHDCFTIAEIIALEDLGFCEPGKATQAVQDGETAIEGRIPVNTDGGLKAKGHPVGATGTAMVVEIFKQLRGESGARQVREPDLGLMHNIGAHGSTAVVNIFERR